ncbi:hypothetical protein PMAYCL1PPCAC_32806, partial [Pristionchus mayeri]
IKWRYIRTSVIRNLHPVMIVSIVLFALLPIALRSQEWLPTCGTTQRQSILTLISTDIFMRHLKSGALNPALTECSNFHRRVCPVGGPPASASTQALFDQILAIEKSC